MNAQDAYPPRRTAVQVCVPWMGQLYARIRKEPGSNTGESEWSNESQGVSIQKGIIYNRNIFG